MYGGLKSFLENVARTGASRRHLLFAALVLVISLLYLSPLAATYRLSMSSEMYSHLILIPLVTAYLVYIKKEESFSCPYHGNLRLQSVLAGSAMLLLGTGIILDSHSLLVASWVFLVWFCFLIVYGAPSFKTVLFPLLFLIFLVPVPPSLLDRLISLLLWGSDHVTAFLFSLTGIPFLHEDYNYRLPHLSIYIAPECSGIRSSTALFLTAVLADYMILRRWWSRSLLLLAVFPLAIFKNGIRIVTLSFLAIYVDPGFMSGNLHRRGGFVFFGITIAIMGIILLVLRRLENRAKGGSVTD